MVSVVADEKDSDDEGDAYWVMAEIGGTQYRLFGCRATDGQHRVDPCGDGLDDWCDAALMTRFGRDAADHLGREALAAAKSQIF